MNYVVAIYDEDGNRAAVLQNATTPQYNRAKNSADQIKLSVPRTDNKVDEVQIGRRFEVLRGGTNDQVVEVSGFISERGYDGEEYIINGFTDEIRLSRYLTPPQFGYPLHAEHDTLASLVQNLDRTYEIERIKWNWTSQSGLVTVDVDTTYDDYIPLASTGTPSVYAEDGYYKVRFEKGANEAWDRIRWLSDYDTGEDGEVRSTLQYRQGNTVAAVVAASWSDPEPGALTDVVGILPADDGATYLEVRINLETDDTDITPRLFSLEVIKRGEYIFDTVTYPAAAADIATPALEADSKPFLDVLIDALAPSEWEFRVTDRTLEIGESFGSDRSNEFTLVES